jgi:hypothetical protein
MHAPMQPHRSPRTLPIRPRSARPRRLAVQQSSLGDALDPPGTRGLMDYYARAVPRCVLRSRAGGVTPPALNESTVDVADAEWRQDRPPTCLRGRAVEVPPPNSVHSASRPRQLGANPASEIATAAEFGGRTAKRVRSRSDRFHPSDVSHHLATSFDWRRPASPAAHPHAQVYIPVLHPPFGGPAFIASRCLMGLSFRGCHSPGPRPISSSLDQSSYRAEHRSLGTVQPLGRVSRLRRGEPCKSAATNNEVA